jgi:hypothetical protein
MARGLRWRVEGCERNERHGAASAAISMWKWRICATTIMQGMLDMPDTLPRFDHLSHGVARQDLGEHNGPRNQ